LAGPEEEHRPAPAGGLDSWVGETRGEHDPQFAAGATDTTRRRWLNLRHTAFGEPAVVLEPTGGGLFSSTGEGSTGRPPRVVGWNWDLLPG
jgi:hypothetical protein